MNKVFKVFVFGLVALLLTACGNVEAEQGMTAQDVFGKAKEASAKLENVRTHISYDDFWKTTAPEKRYSVKYEMTSDAMLQPETVKQSVKVRPLNGDPIDAEVYKVDDRVFIKDNPEKEWEELQSGSVAELFSSMIANVHPTLNLEFFNAFENDFVLEPVDYGYNLKLSLSREQYTDFKKILMLSKNSSEADMVVLNGEFPFINKFDIVIGIDSNNFYVTDFKMTLDTTTYSMMQVDGNSHRVKQTIDAVYSHFDNVDDIKVPAEVLEAAAN
ncbi:hypothetical protein FQ087_03520 [Sporosarcina sp. ANT_H38]|uniref:DUF6612 family protein n=1 Tax=Sporosarcina sp. ANT_H38 TaxID=2597358 RepID=UPI0011F2BB8A|nr:DUF6612 family protein [Sporosarcina sp. ANT_H38]KAA0965389.1 hypothetical protein FQ087_03520 [Sporosarcina sp. ANT_H38]